MYPFLRMAAQLWRFRNRPLGLLETHVTHVRCLPWDLDFAVELNNGRTLTLLDLGRLPFFLRTGVIKALRRHGWTVTMAGVSVRYRRRITNMQRVEMRTRLLGWDARFLYLDQTLWRADGECANQALYRVPVVGRSGIIAPQEALEGGGLIAPGQASPPLPAWVAAWIEADAARPWPPERS